MKQQIMSLVLIMLSLIPGYSNLSVAQHWPCPPELICWCPDPYVPMCPNKKECLCIIYKPPPSALKGYAKVGRSPQAIQDRAEETITSNGN